MRTNPIVERTLVERPDPPECAEQCRAKVPCQIHAVYTRRISQGAHLQIATSFSAEKIVDVKEFVPMLPQDVPVCFIIGGFAHGEYLPYQYQGSYSAV